ncbi:MAG: SGNH/GDSL hydrolase family protein, partial [Polyangia bacterium]
MMTRRDVSWWEHCGRAPRSIRWLLSLWPLVVVATAACGPQDATDQPGSGGAGEHATGGSAAGSGGAANTDSGGNSGTAKGGAATGGAAATGGTTEIGGTIGSGGGDMPGSGGATASGGAGAAQGSGGRGGAGTGGRAGSTGGGPGATGPVTVFIAGDSTVSNYSPTVANKQAGWGQMLPEFFNSQVKISNQAIGGRTSRRFIGEGRLTTILNAMKPGDYLLVQFGTNDGNTTAKYPD